MLKRKMLPLEYEWNINIVYINQFLCKLINNYIKIKYQNIKESPTPMLSS